MKFSDNITRSSITLCYVKRSESQMNEREEVNSNLWSVEISGISYDKATNSSVHLFKTPARDVKIGENIYSNSGNFIAYRVN